MDSLLCVHTLVCVYTCEYMFRYSFVGANVHVCVCVQKPENNFRCHSSGTIHLIFETGSLICLEFTKQAMCGPQGPTHLCLPSFKITSCAAVPALYMSSQEQTQLLVLDKVGILLTEPLTKLLDSQLHCSRINFSLYLESHFRINVWSYHMAHKTGNF